MKLQPSRSNRVSDLKCESKLITSELKKIKAPLPVLFKCKNIHYTNINVCTQQREKIEYINFCHSKREMASLLPVINEDKKTQRI